VSFRPRIAVATLNAAEYTMIADWLATEGFEPIRISSSVRLTDELANRAFDLLLIDGTLAFKPDVQAINFVRARNSQTPIIVLGDPGSHAESQAMVRGAFYLTRPLDRALLSCTVSMAVMESRPLRRSERKRTRFDVVVQGVHSVIIDVSREGLRLEIPKIRKAVPPYFDVAVPMLGVALNVRRLWIGGPQTSVAESIWYGGELSNNTRRVELAWFTLVDALPGSRTSLEVQ
jgi:AmiR/NasT family two-component response regulator